MGWSNVPDVLLSIDSQFENIELVQVVLDDSLKRLELAEDERYWIGIAVREAVANAIQHGNREDPGKNVSVCLSVTSDALEIRVEDQGGGFDPSSVADPLTPENLLKPDGRGIFYMRRFMDDIEYEFGSAGGTVVKLRKTLVALRMSGAEAES